MPTLFDSYVTITDVHIDFHLCVEEPICSDYILLISKSYNRNPDLIPNNLPQALSVVERLLVTNHTRENRYLIDETILAHCQTSIEIESIVKMFINICPMIPIDYRNESCEKIISHVTDKLRRMTCSKALGELFFELAIVLLNLNALEAPSCAQYLFEKQDFYSWKDLTARFADLLRSCSSYDTIDVPASFTRLDSLGSILRLLVDRAKAYPIIYRTTHDEALKSISRWAFMMTNENDRRTWPDHVYKMG
jgi:hypothetical protein